MENKAETKMPCGCGRSPSGYCTGLHSLTEEEYEFYLLEGLIDLEGRSDTDKDE